LPADQLVDPGLEGIVGRASEVEAVADTMGVDPHDLSGSIYQRTSGCPTGHGRRVFQAAGDEPSPRPAERYFRCTDKAERDPSHATTATDAEHDAARALGSTPSKRRSTGGFDVEYDQIAVGVDADDPALDMSSIGERHQGCSVTKVVSVGHDAIRACNESAAAPSPTNGDNAREHPFRDVGDC
jgi:hypothetical protein